MIKIAHLTSAHQRHDTRIFIKMCSSLATHGYDVSLVVADGKGDEINNGVSIVDVGKKNGSRLLRMTKTVNRVFDKSLALDADLYHFHDPELIPIGLKLKKIGKKVIFDIHENTGLQILSKDWIPFMLRKPISYIYCKYENWACKKFDLVIVPQQAMLNKYKNSVNTVLIGNFPHLSDVTTAESYIAKNRYNLLYSGGLSEQRGLFNMLDLIVELKKINSKYQLTLAGQIQSNLMPKVSNHEGWQYTNYLGFVSKDQLYQEYKKNTIGLILLNNVGQYFMAYSLKLFEYMQHGMTVIMPNFGDWLGFNKDYMVGLNVTVFDATQIANAIESLEEADFNNFYQNGINSVLTDFNWESQEKKLIKAYRGIFDAK